MEAGKLKTNEKKPNANDKKKKLFFFFLFPSFHSLLFLSPKNDVLV